MVADHPCPPQPVVPEDPFFRASVVPGVQPTTVAVSGEVDMCTVEKLRAVLHRLRRTDDPHLVLELSGLDFLSATGVSVIAEHLAWLTAAGGSLVLTNPSSGVRRVLTLTGHHHLICDAIPRPRRAGGQWR